MQIGRDCALYSCQFTDCKLVLLGGVASCPNANAETLCQALSHEHASTGIHERPVFVDNKVQLQPMMYVALTYDHRIIDGREAVTFLKNVKELMEDPRRMLLNV